MNNQKLISDTLEDRNMILCFIPMHIKDVWSRDRGGEGGQVSLGKS